MTASDRAAAAPPRALRLSGLLIVIGLIVELATLVWTHPAAFLVFALVGGLLVALGVARYLLVLLTMSRSSSPATIED